MVDELDVDVLRARRRLLDPIRLPERPEPPVVVAEGEPDMRRLWEVAARVGQSQVSALLGGVRWRMSHADWTAVLRVHTDPAVSWDAERGWLLFGWPVDVVSGFAGFPELVLVVDRRC